MAIVYDLVREKIPRLTTDRIQKNDIDIVQKLIKTNQILNTVETKIKLKWNEYRI